MSQEKKSSSGRLNWELRSTAVQKETFKNRNSDSNERNGKVMLSALTSPHGEARATVKGVPLFAPTSNFGLVTDSQSIVELKIERRPRRSRAEVQLANQNKQAGQPITPDTTYLTVNQACQMFPIFTPGALRSLIFNAGGTTKDVKGSERANRFSKVILRVPGQRRILICQQGLRDWLQSER